MAFGAGEDDGAFQLDLEDAAEAGLEGELELGREGGQELLREPGRAREPATLRAVPNPNRDASRWLAFGFHQLRIARRGRGREPARFEEAPLGELTPGGPSQSAAARTRRAQDARVIEQQHRERGGQDREQQTAE